MSSLVNFTDEFIVDNGGNPSTITISLASTLVSVPEKTAPIGSAESISTSFVPTTGVVVQALNTNSNPIYVGGDNVTTSNGLEFLPGASKKFKVDNSNLIYCIALVGSQKLRILIE